MNKDTFIDKKLIHQRYNTFAYGNLSAPTLLKQVGRLWCSIFALPHLL